MRKVRVYELAKEAGMESKELTSQLIEMGYNVKAYNSTLDEEVAAEIRQQLGFKKVEVEETRIQKKGKTTIIRRRSKKGQAEEKVVLKAEPVEEVAESPAEELVAPPAPEEEATPAEEVPEVVAEEVPAAPEEPVVPEVKAEEEAAAPAPPEEPVAPEETPAPAEPEEIKAEEQQEEEAPAVEAKEEKAPASTPIGKIAPQAPQKKGMAKIVGQTVLPLDVNDRPRRPKKVDKKKPRPGQPPRQFTDAPAPAGGKAKKGKRIVKFTNEPAGARGRKGGRRGGADIDASSAAAYGGRMSSRVKIGRGPRGRKKGGKQRQEEQVSTVEMKAAKRKVTIYETISVGELAHKMMVKAGELIGKLMGMGVMATVNQSLDFDTASLIAEEFGYEIEQGHTEEQSVLDLQESLEGGEVKPRPPVITVMGHVDHGKTSILDAIRDTDVAAGEAGGITQHIGAHYVRSPQGDLVFLDTPGHAAFTEMRSRGAQVTDVVVLVVAADDGVMDQTREAVNHARAAEVPLLVAVNKIDKENADPMRVMGELAELDLTPEAWGGDTIFVNTSAQTGEGIEELVENILLQTEILELKADPNRKAMGHVVEAQLHKGRGALATILVQQGTMRVGDSFVVGDFSGKVRSMRDDKGNDLKEAGPATPVEVQGMSGVPMAGDEFVVVTDDKMAKSVSSERQMKKREKELASTTKISLDNLFDKLQEGEVKELKILLRSDVQGTLEAFSTALEKLTTVEIKVKVLHSGTGTITESDVLLAAASDALIIGFNVRPSAKVTELAEKEKVDLRFYDVIYHALEDIENAMVGMLEPIYEEEVIGGAEVRETFGVPKVGTIAGCMVTSGHIERNAGVRLLRDGVVVYTGTISSLRRFKDDVKEVQNGYECGIGLENYNDIKIGDLIEAYVMKEVAATLTK
ncbi:MAG: translation initiation factor IF-2 [Thermodesulfobacteriota bacterium]